MITDPIHNVEYLKIPPWSVEAEQAVIGSCMLSTAAFDIVSEIVNADDFYRKDHRLIYSAIEGLHAREKPTDVLMLAEYLEQTGELEKAGGLLYLGVMAKDTPTAAHAKYYAQVVKENSIRRQIISTSEENIELAHDKGQSLEDLINTSQAKVVAISETGASKPVSTINSLLSEVIDDIDHRFNHQGEAIGIPTCFKNLNKKILGLENDDLIIVAGRPSMGKTAFAMNIAERAAIEMRIPTAIFSMEMSGKQLTMRMVSSIGGIDHFKLREGKLEDHHWPKLTTATSLLNKAPLYIDDRPALSVPQIRARCRSIKREHGLGLVVVDYLQLMASTSKEGRVTQITEISRGLKAIAKEFNVPVIALSQLNRSLENRPNKRPVMSDLRESGAIEQDADIIIFLYRDVVYNTETKYPDVAEANISKQRNGPIGKVLLHSELHYMRFQDHIGEIPEYEHYAQSYDKKGGFD